MLQKKKHFELVALIDADKIKHLVAYSVGELLKQNYTLPEIDVVGLIEDRLNAIHNSFSAKAIIFCFSGKSSNTFRYQCAFEKEYKGNRSDNNFYEGKLEVMMFVVEYIKKVNHVLVFNTLEADDILSMLQCKHTFIWSNDKDMNQIPGWHFDHFKLNLYKVTEEDAHRNLCYQMIVGDTTDNIGGIKGFGDKKALEILGKAPLKIMLHTILLEYQKKFGITEGTDAFTEVWNLVKLRGKRGAYFIEKYKSAFELIELLTKDLQ